jgi:Flp pilus assembly pilin Flp
MQLSVKVIRRLKAVRPRHDERGATFVEYALLLMLVAMAAFIALGFVGQSLSHSLNSTGNSLFP